MVKQRLFGQPNLQNIPIRTELGKQVRDALTPPISSTSAGIDFAQFELQIMEFMTDKKETK